MTVRSLLFSPTIRIIHLFISASSKWRNIPMMLKNPYFMASIFTMASQKGGVGKTTTSAALAAAYQEQGKRVLAVDLDPQGGLTIAFGFAPEAIQRTMYHVLSGQATLESIIIPTKIPGISLAPANLDLAGA